MRPLLLLGLAASVFAQGTNPREKPEDYPAYAQARSAWIGGQFTVHSFSGEGRSYLAKGFLVVELALYPPRGRSVDVHSGNFALHINGRKHEVLPQMLSLVAAAITHGDADNTPPGNLTPRQLLLQTALPQGEHSGPVSGFLYFPYAGKVSAIRSLELQYEDSILQLRIPPLGRGHTN